MLEAGKASLPYALTKSQEKVLAEILEEVTSGTPMLRLLQVSFSRACLLLTRRCRCLCVW